VEIGEFMASGQESFVFQSWIMAKVHKQTQFAAARAKVIQDLRAVFIGQDGNSLDFDDDLIVANEIRAECLKQLATAILRTLRWFRHEWNSLEFEFNLQAFVIDRFVDTAALIFVKLEACTNDRVTFFPINQFRFFFISCHFVYFVG
jgi:hypothetical protein